MVRGMVRLSVCALLLVALPAPRSRADDKKAWRLPRGMAYVNWSIGVQEFDDVHLDVTIHDDPGSKVGLYLQFFEANVGAEHFYFGFQTDLADPGGKRGKGFIFSRWGPRDLSNVRATPTGWAVQSGDEGDFVSVRQRYHWTDHSYRIRFTPVDEDDAGVWYGVFVLDKDTGVENYGGSIRFRKEDGRKRPKIHDGGGTWIECYSGATSEDEVPRFHVSIESCSVDGGKPRARSAVSNWPDDVARADVSFEETAKGAKAEGRIHMLVGKGVTRTHTKGPLFGAR
jgi:hypothetical protein